jgi:hypothetical protein
MSDAKQNPGATPDRKPQNQVGADKGPIKGPQVTEDQMERDDVAAGSAGDRRRASKGAR